MKAILVIDIQEDYEGSVVDVKLYGKTNVVHECYVNKLKPMPQKNKYDVNKWATVNYENNITLGHYMNIAWNECIDEIAGEKE